MFGRTKGKQPPEGRDSKKEEQPAAPRGLVLGLSSVEGALILST